MEEDQNQETQETQKEETHEESTQTSSSVSFPTVNQPKKTGSGAKTLLIIGVLVLVAVLGFVIYKSASKKSEEVLTEPTPFENLTNPTEEQTGATATPNATPLAADKTKIKIQVQNGTGISGEAAYLQTQLKSLGYSNVTTGNSTQQDLTATQVSFADSVPADIVTEITNKLTFIYQKVTTTTATSTLYDVVVVTGLKKGATPKPTATSTATPTSSPVPSATP